MSGSIHLLSQRLGEVSEEQINRALGRFGLGRLLSIAPVPLGLFGQNAFVTSTAGEFVLRGAPHTAWQFPTERYYARVMFENGIPAPWPCQIDDSCEILPWSYVIMPRMAGIQAADPAVRAGLNESDRLDMARALAEMLASIHRIRFATPGRFDPEVGTLRPLRIEDEMIWPFHRRFEKLEGDPPAHHEIVTARIDFLLKLSSLGEVPTSGEDRRWVSEVVDAAQTALRVPTSLSLVMEDYKEENVVFLKDELGWRVSGVFDLMGCYSGDGEADLSRTAAAYWLEQQPRCASAFISTYLALTQPRDGFIERFRAYMLLDRLIIWTYLQRHEPDVIRRLGGFRIWAEPYTEIASRVL